VIIVVALETRGRAIVVVVAFLEVQRHVEIQIESFFYYTLCGKSSS
jgi:hypothetical protein